MRRLSLLTVAPLVAVTLASAPATAADEAAKSPRRILADVQRDLAKVSALHVRGTEVDADGTTKITGDLTASGDLRVAVTQGRATFRLTVADAATYLKANAAYWRAAGGTQGAALAKQVAGKWVRIPPSASKELAAPLAKLTPKALAGCVTADLGTVTKRGTRRLGGRRVVVLADAGDKPGTAPGQLFVTTAGPVLPVRSVQTGRRRAGRVDADCADARATTRRSDLRFSRFGVDPRITAPAGAVDLSDLGPGAANPS